MYVRLTTALLRDILLDHIVPTAESITLFLVVPLATISTYF